MRFIPNWVIVVITVLVFTLAFGGTYFLGRSAGVAAKTAEIQTERVLALNEAAKREHQLRIDLETERERLRTVSGKLQDALAGKKVVYEEVTNTIVKEVEKPVYRESHLPSSGVQVLSDAAERLNTTRQTKN